MTSIDEATRRLVADLREITRRAAVRAVDAALGGPGLASPASSSRPASQPRRWRTASARPDRARGLDARILGALHQRSPQRIGELAAALGIPSKKVAPAIARLLATGRLEEQGAGRGRRYSIV